MRPRITWRSRPGPEVLAAEPLPHIRQRYGDDVADVVERCATLLKVRRRVPTAQDVKRTLRTVAEQPAAANLRRIDGWTEARIVAQAARRHRLTDLRALTPAQLSDCASAALDSFRWIRTGRPATDDVAADLVRALLRLAAGWPRATQDGLLCDALAACGCGYDARNLQRLREAAAKRGTFFSVT